MWYVVLQTSSWEWIFEIVDQRKHFKSREFCKIYIFFLSFTDVASTNTTSESIQITFNPAKSPWAKKRCPSAKKRRKLKPATLMGCAPGFPGYTPPGYQRTLNDGPVGGPVPKSTPIKAPESRLTPAAFEDIPMLPAASVAFVDIPMSSAASVAFVDIPMYMLPVDKPARPLTFKEIAPKRGLSKHLTKTPSGCHV